MGAALQALHRHGAVLYERQLLGAHLLTAAAPEQFIRLVPPHQVRAPRRFQQQVERRTLAEQPPHAVLKLGERHRTIL